MRLLFARAAGCAVSLVVLAWAAGPPAVAQSYPPPAPYYYGVGPDQVLARIQSMGLRPVSEPHLRGPVWVVRAEGREGTQVRVLVEAGTGRVVNIAAIERPYPPHIASGGPVSEGPWVPMRGPGYGDGLPPPPASGPYGAPPAAEGRAYPSPNTGYSAGPQSPSYTGSAYGPGPQSPRESSGQTEKKKVAARPVTPLPKPRPSDAAKDASKKESPAVAATAKEPEATGSIPAGEKKSEGASSPPAKTPDVPVAPLE